MSDNILRPNTFLTISSVSLEQLQLTARIVAAQIKSGDIIALSGEFGAGKTTFARAFIQSIAIGAPTVTSPTFTLMQSYDVQSPDATTRTLWHLDLCRLEDTKEAEALGLRELWPHIVLIEWPEIIEPLLPEGYLHIGFGFTASKNTRALSFSGNDAWRQRLLELHTLS